MKWFKHDSDAIGDAKIRKLVMKYGAIGYAIYFHCLELIAGDIAETNITFELEHDSEIIADNLRIQGKATKSGANIVSEIMAYMLQLRLFDCSGDRIFCYKMLKRIDASMLTANGPMRKLIQAAKETYDKSHDLVMTKSCYTILDKTRQDYTILEETKLEETAQTRLAEKSISTEAKNLAFILYDLHTAIDTGYKKPNLDTWAADIEKLNRLDGRDWESIESVIRWAKADQFWRANIISGKKLREKFPQLVAKMGATPYDLSHVNL